VRHHDANIHDANRIVVQRQIAQKSIVLLLPPLSTTDAYFMVAKKSQYALNLLTYSAPPDMTRA
jgi:hypothetical protein